MSKRKVKEIDVEHDEEDQARAVDKLLISTDTTFIPSSAWGTEWND